MAGFQIHLAIGKEYIKKHKINDINSFMKGIIAPDLGDKRITHYSGFQDKANLKEYLANKVDLKKFLESNKIDDDYSKGVFLHLITDYLFFNNFFDEYYLSKVSYEDFCKDLYYSYDKSNCYVEDKYDLRDFSNRDMVMQEIEKSRKEKRLTDEVRQNILENSKIDKFIEDIATINLEEYRNKILNNN